MDFNGMDLKEWIQVLELGLKIVVAVAAGVWAVFLLIYLRRSQLAQADLLEKDAKIRETDAKILDIEFKHRQATDEQELKTKQTEMQIKEIELRIKQQANLVVDLQHSILHSPDDNGYIIVVVAILTNTGNRDTTIAWDSPTLSVRLVKFDHKGKPEYYAPIELDAMSTRDPTRRADPLRVRGGGTEMPTFVCRVPVAGLYLLSFRGPVDQKTREEVGGFKPSAWTYGKYVDVSDNQITEDPRTTTGRHILATQLED